MTAPQAVSGPVPVRQSAPTAGARMRAFDHLPRAVRQFLACEATYDYEVRNIAAQYRKFRRDGYSVDAIVDLMRKRDAALSKRLHAETYNVTT